VEKIRLMSAILLNGQFACMVTKWLWIDNNTFVVPHVATTAEDVVLVYISLSPGSNKFSISRRTITFLKDFVMSTSVNFGYINFFGNFFTFPRNDQVEDVPYFYFITHCPKPHRHARLLIVSRKDLKIVRYLDLPGDVVEVVIDANQREIFLAISITKKFQFNWARIEGAGAVPNAPSYKSLVCHMSDPWIGKEVSSSLKDRIIFKVKENGIAWESHQCYAFKTHASPGLDNVTNETHRVQQYLNSTAYSSNLMHVSKEFIIAHDDQTVASKVLSRFHHYHFDNSLHHRFVRCARTYFHPTRPIVLGVSIDCKYFRIFLDEWADDDDREEFPSLENSNSFNYRQDPIVYVCESD
jgi:hypothetical protein